MTDEIRLIDQIATMLDRYRLRFGNEMRLQQGVANILKVEYGFAFRREHQLDDRNKIDFFAQASGIGIECKVDGSPSAVLAQLTRYAEFDRVNGLILVTSRHTHRFSAPEIMGKPFRVVWIGANL